MTQIATSTRDEERLAEVERQRELSRRADTLTREECEELLATLRIEVLKIDAQLADPDGRERRGPSFDAWEKRAQFAAKCIQLDMARVERRLVVLGHEEKQRAAAEAAQMQQTDRQPGLATFRSLGRGSR